MQVHTSFHSLRNISNDIVQNIAVTDMVHDKDNKYMCMDSFFRLLLKLASDLSTFWLIYIPWCEYLRQHEPFTESISHSAQWVSV